jgi:hypothetical protein
MMTDDPWNVGNLWTLTRMVHRNDFVDFSRRENVTSYNVNNKYLIDMRNLASEFGAYMSRSVYFINFSIIIRKEHKRYITLAIISPTMSSWSGRLKLFRLNSQHTPSFSHTVLLNASLLILCNLFDDSVSNSDCIAFNDWTDTEEWSS